MKRVLFLKSFWKKVLKILFHLNMSLKEYFSANATGTNRDITIEVMIIKPIINDTTTIKGNILKECVAEKINFLRIFSQNTKQIL